MGNRKGDDGISYCFEHILSHNSIISNLIIRMVYDRYMKVSVVVIAYNEEKFLDECLDALQDQTRKPDEIIVVDNNSTDKTAQIAKEKGARVIREMKQGASHARNAGFDASTGDIILRTDADSIVPADWVERMSDHFEDEKVGIVCGGVTYYKKFLDPLSHLLIFWIDDIFGYKAITGPNFGIRKSVWKQIRDEVHTEDSKFHEDLDLSIHAQKHGKYVRDYGLMVLTSPRKVGSYKIFFVKYPQKWIHTIFNPEHRKLSTNSFLRRI